MKKLILSLAVVLQLIGFASIVRSQMPTGNGFTVEKAVVASGGGASSGNGFAVEGTAGQTITRESANNGFLVSSGFWNSNFAPTAASVSISGRVLTTDGAGLRNAIVLLTDQSGALRTARTTTFGYYRFDGIEAGQTVVISVRSKLFQFETRVLMLNAELADVDFTPSGTEENIKR